ncbi:MAG: class I SAM-dependent methyltransferase [Hungatella sp.]|nr:class I SAM-dependent methyltransferase [Hungatella sp.]
MELKIEEVKEFYEQIEEVWPKDDKWHQYSKNQILQYIARIKYGKSVYLLNAGSGGSNYGLSQKMMHLDIAENKINCFPEYTVSSIEDMPFKENTFTDIICVGSVINYCDAIAAIHEFSRVLLSGGSLVLEFESSWGYEHRKSSCYKQDADIAQLPYFGELHSQWLYSPKYISNILKMEGFNINNEYRFHYLSGISFSKCQDENKAAKYVEFDSLCRIIPFIKQHSNNVIFSCIKL